MRTLGSLGHNNPICICPANVVRDTPAVGSLCERLLVHDDPEDYERQTLNRVNNMAFEQHFPTTNFANFERDNSAPADHTAKFSEGISHKALPGPNIFVFVNSSSFWIDPSKPAPQPVASFVIYYVQKRGRRNDEIDLSVFDFRSIVRGLCQQ